MTERTILLKQHIQQLNDAGPRRTTFYSVVGQSLITNSQLPVSVRRAQAFSDLLDQTDLVVLPYELVAGSILGSWPVASEAEVPDRTEQHVQAMDAVRSYIASRCDKDLDTHSIAIGFKKQVSHSDTRFALMARDHYDASISFDDMQAVIRDVQLEYRDQNLIEPHEIARVIERHFEFQYDRSHMEAIDELPWEAANHVDLHYAAAIETGLENLEKIIAGKQEAAHDSKHLFYHAELIAVRAVIRFIERYAVSLELEKETADIKRATELQEMADICRKIAKKKPASFREGLQLVWMLHVIGNLAGGSALSFARFDQYMHCLYEDDLNKGVITRQDAAQLLSCVWLKINEPKMRTVQSLCLGGVKPDGSSGANALSCLVLETIRELKLPYPNVSVRYDASVSPDWLLEEAIKTIQSGFGQPMLLNDQLWIPNLMKLCYPQEAARDYYNMGCVEIMIQGRQPNWIGGGGVNFPRLVLSVINDVISNGSDLTDFDSFLEKYQAKLRSEVDQLAEHGMHRVQYAKQHYYDPYASLFVKNCIDSGIDFFRGGTDLPYLIAISGTGLGTAADSLMAIKQFVYDQAEFSLSELAHMLDSNYDGFEKKRQMIEQQVLHYGNDIDEVDQLAASIFKTYADHVYSLNHKHKDSKFVNVLFSYNSHVSQGEVTGATPDGRYKGATLSDCVGPVQGKDISGPTSMINSVLRLESQHITGAYALNVKLSAAWAANHAAVPIIISLVNTFFSHGGPQMQFNMQHADELKAAQQNPSEHRDLIVRIAGYCEYFNNLDSVLQNEIISRSEHAL